MRNFYWILGGSIVLWMAWYFLLKPAEFEVNFKTKTSPGDVIQVVKIWNKALENGEIESVTGGSVQQKIMRNGHFYVYKWTMEWEDDSTTSVNIQITEPKKNFQNKLLVPFMNTEVESVAEDIARTFYAIMKEHLEITKVKIEGEELILPRFCLCTTQETQQTEKAYGMMEDYAVLSTFIADHKLEVKGQPMVSVQSWDHDSGQLKFNFCFPIVPQDSLPHFERLEYRQFEKQRAIKATYKGNYITSDRAWYALLKYATDKKLKVTGLPMEFFYNNPSVGGNETKWRAEVYLPIE